ncbi:MAG: Lipoprotein signal peptidase [Spartobacteria bacterium]|nr:Lipoprotein signal peptidase [Spartobacteria bacterium]
MISIYLTLLGVIVSDQVLKQLLRRVMGPGVAPLGPFGQIRVGEGRLWLRRLHSPSSRFVPWALWTAAALALMLASRWLPSSEIFIGLLLGGSLSNAADDSRYGSVNDYICLRFWPAFNLADLAIAVGAIGTLVELLTTVRGAAS